MKKASIKKLNQLNHHFYQASGIAFSATRATSWSGWNNLLPFLQEIFEHKSGVAQVLDLGCGNGRFFDFLRVHCKGFQYLGLDNSPTLLSIARSTFPEATFGTFDIIEKYLETGKINFASEKKFDLIVLFGVSHHLPSKALRKQLLADLQALLSQNGLLIVSNWQFAADWQRFSTHQVTWQRIWRNTFFTFGQKVKLWCVLWQFEPQDYLLDWRTGSHADEVLRYCHFLGQAEMLELAATANLEVVASFFADGKSGKLNEYFVLKAV